MTTERPVTYLLRTCAADLTSHHGFQWPESGPVACPDWHPGAHCGNGLHGLLMGAGDGSLLNWDADARWLVVAVDAADVVDLHGKVKVPRGEVVYCGDRQGATARLVELGADPALVVGGTATAGDGGTATAGYRGTATAGDGGTATAGDGGTATAGDYGTATAGDYGTATAGEGGTVLLKWWGARADGGASRWRYATGYVGEDGIEPGVAYSVDGQGRITRVETAAASATPEPEASHG